MTLLSWSVITIGYNAIISKEEYHGQKKERKAKYSRGSGIYPLIINLIAENNAYELTLGQIWESLINRLLGKYDPRKPDQYQTYEYGMMHRNTISIKIADTFGAERKRKNNGIVLIFDKEKSGNLGEDLQQ